MGRPRLHHVLDEGGRDGAGHDAAELAGLVLVAELIGAVEVAAADDCCVVRVILRGLCISVDQHDLVREPRYAISAEKLALEAKPAARRRPRWSSPASWSRRCPTVVASTNSDASYCRRHRHGQVSATDLPQPDLGSARPVFGRQHPNWARMPRPRLWWSQT